MGRAASTGNDDDPLTLAIAPPADETPEMRAQRLQEEQRAKEISDEIDNQLLIERNALKKKQKMVKVLLLGQSESGKSTTLKNFQLTYARKAWTAEKEAWRIVIQLNLVRSINTVAAAVVQELAAAQGESASVEVEVSAEGDDGASVVAISNATPDVTFPLTDAHRVLVERLKPLRAVQTDLELRLGSGAEEDFGVPNVPSRYLSASGQPFVPGQQGIDVTQAQGSSTNGYGLPPLPETFDTTSPFATRKSQEFFVRSNGWKSALSRLRPRMSTSSRVGRPEALDEPNALAISGAKDAIKALWTDSVVQDVIKQRKIRLQDCAEFYLSEVDRVADLNYTPSDDDVIRARLRTIGVQEHRILLETGPEAGKEWLIYDVGGSRTTRAQWPSFFDDVNAIIFLAPVNCFDERLLEDRTINRLDDSLQLWKFVCTNKLLAHTELVLFLNKCDLLDKKLKSGAKFSEWVKSYTGPNDAVQVATYLKGKFTEVCRHYSKEHRGLHIHFTSVIDTKATAKTLAAVQDGILRTNLRQLDLI